MGTTQGGRLDIDEGAQLSPPIYWLAADPLGNQYTESRW